MDTLMQAISLKKKKKDGIRFHLINCPLKPYCPLFLIASSKIPGNR